MKTLAVTDRKEIDEIIARSKICHAGMADTDGTPYVLPMNFGYRDNVIYLHSAQEGSSIDILNRNDRICITFCIDHALAFQHPQVACSYRMKSKSVIAWGRVRYEEDFDKKVEALDIIMKQYSDKEFTYSRPAVVNVKIWKVEIEKITCKVFGVPHNKNKEI